VGNSRKPDYNDIQNLLEHCKILGCSVNINLNSMHSHADYFPQSLGSVSHEYYDRFHQDVRERYTRSQDGQIVNMIADHCWMLKRKSTCVESCRKKKKMRKFHSFL